MNFYKVKHIEDCFGRIAYIIKNDIIVERRENDKYIMFKALPDSQEEFEMIPCYDSINGQLIGFIKK